jgi:penicillin-binding protein 1B
VLELAGRKQEQLTLDAPVLSTLLQERAKQRLVHLHGIAPPMVQAVLAIEDRRFYYHPGVDPIRFTGAIVAAMIGKSGRIQATSTLTQQLIRNVFIPQMSGWTLQSARDRSNWSTALTRKTLEIWMSLIISHRATKDEILEMYLNAVPLGQRGSFAIVGVSEAARLFFGKDVSNLTIPEAATIAGVIQSPSALSPFTNPSRCRDRRNVVIRAMADSGFITATEAAKAIETPLEVVQRALESEAPHFVDYVVQTFADNYPGLTTDANQPIEIYTTLDLHLQRLAQDAVRAGLTHVDELLARRKRKGLAEAALISIDPRTGDILAMVGGRSYNQSQYNRATVSRRQPGSVFKPFVYLTAFEESARRGSPLTPASVMDDTPTTWEFDEQTWTPENFEHEYDGMVTLRRALARSNNIVAIKVAEQTGYDKVAALWKRLGVGAQPRAYPSIALGVFEATPYEIATAYTIFPNGGVEKKLRNILRVAHSGNNVTVKETQPPKSITREDTTYLVTSMMRSVINEGTGASARANGFTLDAAGKTGTTNDLRDAWFVGFTPELLTVVWVGFDDNQPVGLSGSQAALPIWTDYMKRALAGHPNMTFQLPDGITSVEIDRNTGMLATPLCPSVISEVFLSGTEPTELCPLHLPLPTAPPLSSQPSPSYNR